MYVLESRNVFSDVPAFFLSKNFLSFFIMFSLSKNTEFKKSINFAVKLRKDSNY